MKEKIYKIAKDLFNINEFFPLQLEVIESILGSNETLAIFPTGSGKSICYQIPALLSEGLTLVVSPLVSLMKDQVENLKNKNIPAEYISSTLKASKNKEILENLNKIKLLYITPERLGSKQFKNFIKKQNVKISIIAIDEIHSVSLWGRSFRPSYLGIKNFIKEIIPRPVVCGFTATLNERILKDIKNFLDLKNPVIFRKTTYRDNLKIEVRLTDEKFKTLFDIINKEENTIIFVSSKLTLEYLVNLLGEKNFNITYYHGDLSPEEKEKNQNAFLTEEKNIMVATSAFGMGIDKKNIRKVIHFEIPYEIEEYFQEIGRAGRDGKISSCITILSTEDFSEFEKMIEKKYPSLKTTLNEIKNILKKSLNFSPLLVVYEIQKVIKKYLSGRKERKLEIEKFKKVTDFLLTDECRFKTLLKHFNEAIEKCGKCDNCTNKKHFIENIDKVILASTPEIFWIKLTDFYKIIQGKSLFLLPFKGHRKLAGFNENKIKDSIIRLKNYNLIKIKRKNFEFYIRAK
jgi:ATP-dependent DNA helicase RecQ